jgi:predicted GTPase
MPYGDLSRQRLQRFASAADLDPANCTAEEREEYESHLAMGEFAYKQLILLVHWSRICAAAIESSEISCYVNFPVCRELGWLRRVRC